MKIAIVGTGAMGSIYAALLADTGHEVWAIDPWRAHIDAIRKDGLRVEGASGDRTVTSIQVGGTPDEAGGCDLYVIATKASGVGSAARSIAPLMRPDSLVLTIQNGLGAAERIAEHMPTDNVLLGVAEGFGASIAAPGHAHHNAMKMIRIGEMGGGLTPRLEQLVQTWREAGFNAHAFEDINQLVWEKFLCNVTFSAPCTIFGCTIGELMADPDRWAIALGCMREAYRLGQARKIAFSFAEPVDYVTAFGAAMPNARPSMLLDHMAKRPSELDAINGRVPVLGQELGIETPYNQTISTILREREASFTPAG